MGFHWHCIIPDCDVIFQELQIFKKSAWFLSCLFWSLTYFPPILYMLPCVLVWIVSLLRNLQTFGEWKWMKNLLIIFSVELGLMSLFDWCKMEVSWYKAVQSISSSITQCAYCLNACYLKYCLLLGMRSRGMLHATCAFNLSYYVTFISVMMNIRIMQVHE